MFCVSNFIHAGAFFYSDFFVTLENLLLRTVYTMHKHLKLVIVERIENAVYCLTPQFNVYINKICSH